MYKRRNTKNAFIPLGSNIQFSTNTEKEQIIKKNFSSNIVGTLYHLNGNLFKINPNTAND